MPTVREAGKTFQDGAGYGNVRLSTLLMVLLVAGCLGTSPETGREQIRTIDLNELDVGIDHDHDDPALHRFVHGLELVQFRDARDLIGDEEARLSDIQFSGSLATVTVNGRAGPSSGGFLLFDASDPANLKLLSRYRSGSEDNWYTKFSPDGRYVFLTANGGTNADAAVGALQEDLETTTATGPLRGIHAVDVSNPADPQLAAVWPVPVRVVNLAPWTARDGSTILFASDFGERPFLAMQPPAPGESLTEVSILQFHVDPPRFEKLGGWKIDGFGADLFPHDLEVRRHPSTDEDLLYVAHWNAGGFILNVTDPRNPQTVAEILPHLVGGNVHTLKAHPEPLDGRVFAVLSPETFADEPSGQFRLLDVTQPTEPRLLSNWSLPPGDLVNPVSLLWSPHEFTLANGRLYASLFHGGVWVLDLETFQPVATWQRSLGDPARTGDWAVDVETVVAHVGYVYAVDMGSGIYVLREAPDAQ